MTKRESQFKEIKNRLLYFQTELTCNAKLNLLDGHNFSEDFYCSLCNLIFKYELMNANYIHHNFPVIDLVDDKNKIIIQVSGNASKRKIDETLDSNIYTKYKKYQLLFIFIGSENHHLKKNTYTVPNTLLFNPSENIYFVSDIIKCIRGITEESFEKIYSLVINQIQVISVQIDGRKVSENLSFVIKSLAINDLRSARRSITKPFDIEKKIEHNNLVVNKELIEKYQIYFSHIQTIYDTYTREAINMSESVWGKIHQLSIDIQIEDGLQGDKLFSAIWKRAYDIVINDPDLLPVKVELIEMCVKIVVVDAFLRCKILKYPGEVEF